MATLICTILAAIGIKTYTGSFAIVWAYVWTMLAFNIWFIKALDK